MDQLVDDGVVVGQGHELDFNLVLDDMLVTALAALRASGKEPPPKFRYADAPSEFRD
jgi:hypothetical protein